MSRFAKVLGWLTDAALLLFVVFLIPAAILLIGTPLALLLRFVIEIATRR